MLIYINSFHVNTQELSFKIIIQRSRWIRVSLSLHWPTDLGSFPESRRVLTRNRYKKLLSPRYHSAEPADLQGSEEQAGTTLPIDSTTNRSDHGTSSIPLCTGPQKSTSDPIFRGNKPYTVLKHTQELVTSHESIGLSSETLKKGGVEERGPLWLVPITYFSKPQ